jgi:hypothetical protein
MNLSAAIHSSMSSIQRRKLSRNETTENDCEASHHNRSYLQFKLDYYNAIIGLGFLHRSAWLSSVALSYLVSTCQSSDEGFVLKSSSRI